MYCHIKSLNYVDSKEGTNPKDGGEILWFETPPSPQKNCMKLKKKDWEGASIPDAPLGLIYQIYEQCYYFSARSS